ncbi:unnamed protein product, partial [marine sediment metagenome]
MAELTLDTNPLHMPLRAENLNVHQIMALRQNFDGYLRGSAGFSPSRLYRQLLDFFSVIEDNPFQRRFQLGLKGWGKTLSTLLALNRLVSDSDKTPLMLYFVQETKTINVFPPENMAPVNVWSDRIYTRTESVEELIEKANVVVIDDIHYIFENAISFPYLLDQLIYLLNLLYNKTNGVKDFKVLLLSEEPIFMYAQQLVIL